MGIEIEKKFTVKKIPENIEQYPFHQIEQGYLNVHPAIRVRQEDDTYYMTYKGADGSLAKEEYNLPLDQTSYQHILAKADGNIITKKRYLIPLNDDAFDADYLNARSDFRTAIQEGTIKIELDIFEGTYKGLIIAEVEFPDLEAAESYNPAPWFDQEVTGQREYSNAYLSNQRR